VAQIIAITAIADMAISASASAFRSGKRVGGARVVCVNHWWVSRLPY
jgi:hypothetical protein